MPEPGDVYRSKLEPFWRSVGIYDGEDSLADELARLPPKIGHLFAAHWCQSEICNGGFHQFFTNATGVLAPEAHAAFLAIGMPQCAALIAEAILFFESPYPRDLGVRQEVLAAQPGDKRAEWDPFYKLDDRFYAALEAEGGFAARADQYAAGS